MQQVYRIDNSKIPDIRKKAMIRTLKMFVISIPTTFVTYYFLTNKYSFISDLWIVPIILAFLAFTMYRAVGRLVEIYKTLEITLTDAGIERLAETWPYKTIKWEDMQLKQNSNGDIDLYDKNISVLNRNIHGRGWIKIQPEIENVDQLLNQIQRKISS